MQYMGLVVGIDICGGVSVLAMAVVVRGHHHAGVPPVLIYASVHPQRRRINHPLPFTARALLITIHQLLVVVVVMAPTDALLHATHL